MLEFFNLLIYTPLYNAILYLVLNLQLSLGLATILLILIIKIILFPLNKKTVETNLKMKSFKQEIDVFSNKLKGEKNPHKKIEIYKNYKKFNKKNGISPGLAALSLLIQIPIIISLFFVFKNISTNIIIFEKLYFVPDTMYINNIFLNFNLFEKSFILSILVGITQYLLFNLTIGKIINTKTTNFKEEFIKNFQTQIKYVFPIIIIFISFSLGSLLSLYWITSNIFSFFQEKYIRKNF